jgi:DNA-binding LytR/AlgR family response regulator
VELAEASIFVKTDGKLLKVAYGDILYIEAFADYVKIWISEEKRLVTLQTMKSMEHGLPADKFIRVHRSYIVALDKITAVNSTSVVVANREIPVGKIYKENITRLVKGVNRITR